MLVFKHPKYYEEMRKRARAHQKELQASHVKKAISPKQSTDSGGRAPSDSTGGVPGNADITVTSVKLQAASDKLQATSNKLQASGKAASSKR